MKYEILLHLRQDGFAKRGGDTSLIESFSKVLKEQGYEVVIMNSPFCDLENIRCVISINFDRPFESCILLNRTLKKNVPFIIYTLHHPMQGVKDYISSDYLKGARKKISDACCKNVYCYETSILIMKLISSFDYRYIKYLKFLSVRFSQRFIIKNANLLLTVNEFEKNMIEFDSGIKVDKYKFLPHFFELNSLTDVEKEEKLVVCAGRIEPRKNQQLVIKLARRFPDCRFVFVGSASPTALEYYDQCIELSKAVDNIEFESHLDMSALRELMSKAELFISLSYFEVVSLTELEAYSQYCKMLLSNQSYISHFIGSDSVAFVDVNDEDSVLSKFEELLMVDLVPGVRADALMNSKFDSMSKSKISSSLKQIIEENI